MPEPVHPVKPHIVQCAAIGVFATPDIIHIIAGLAKTRSGRIMRRILRKTAG